MKQIKLTFAEQKILEGLDNETLKYLFDIYEGKNFLKLTELSNKFIDIEKNQFFGEDEVDGSKLQVLHAYARGRVSGLLIIPRLCVGAKNEIERREEERKKA